VVSLPHAGRPRVLHVSAVDFTGEKLLQPQLDALVARGYDVRLACGRSSEPHWQALSHLRPVDIAFSRRAAVLATIGAVSRLWRLAWAWRPQVLHLHTPAASLPVRLLPRWVWPRGMRVVYTVHGFLHQWPTSGRAEQLVQRLEQLEARRTDLMLFQSAEDHEQSVARRYRSRLVLLGNGVEDAWFSLPMAERSSGALRVLFVGRLVREKGVLDLVSAVADLPEVTLDVVGSALSSDRDPVGDELVVARQEVCPADRVRLHGSLSKAALLCLYASVDVVCLPSYREGVPRSLIEGLAAGRPAVATDIRGCRELVITGENGLLVQPGDVHGLREALRRVAALAPHEFAAMATAARRSVDPERREAAVVERLVEAYRSLGVRV